MKSALYLGERVNIIGKIFQVFKDEKGQEYNYQGIKSVWIGDCYQILPGDKMAVRPKEVERFRELTEKERTEIEAQKLAVRAQRQLKRKAMELRKPHPSIVQAIKLLSPFYRSLGRFDQERFTAFICNEMSKRPKK